MGMPTLLTVNGTGTSAVWQPDWMQNPFNISIGTICNSTASYQIEACMDDLNVSLATSLATNAFTAGNATWYPIATTTVFQSSTTMNVQFPVTGLRVNVKSSTAGSTVSVNFMQATFGR
jgi:hypothetical protein